MSYVISLVLLVDAIVLVKMLGAAIRAKLDSREIINDTYWTRVGFLMVFHVVMLIVSGFVIYIGAIVKAAL